MKNQLFQALGGFWNEVPAVRQLVYALAEVQKQTDQEVRELENALSRHTIDVYRLKFWYPLDIAESETVQTWDSGAVFDEAGLFDQALGTVSVTIPEEIVSFEAVTDRITDPSWELHPDTRSFSVPAGLKRVWLKNARLDKEDLYRQFGYLLGLKTPSSEQSKAFLNALLDALVNGPSAGTLFRGLSAMTGTEVSEKDLTWDVPALVLDRGYTGLCCPVTFLNRPCAVTVRTEDDLTRADIETLPKEMLDHIHRQGILNARPITDPCELARIQEILNVKLETVTPEGPEEETEVSSTGLGTYAHVHRMT